MEGSMKYSRLLLAIMVPVILLALFITSLQTKASPSATFTVNSTIDAVDVNPGDGVCETAVDNNICTLRAAVMEANSSADSTTINLPSGIYTFTISGTLEEAGATGDIDITSSVAIVGEDKVTTIIDANSIERIFDIQPSTSQAITLTNLTLQNGSGSSNVGDTYGGAVCNCTSFGTVYADNILIRNNYSTDGGAGIANYGTFTIANSTIINNRTAYGGGGLRNVTTNSTMTISNSAILDNEAFITGFGGGINNAGSMAITNSTIAGNESKTTPGDFGGIGGGIWNYSGTTPSPVLTITNSTIANNSATITTTSGLASQDGTVWVYNTIIANNLESNCSDLNFFTLISGGGNLEDRNDCNFDQLSDQNNIDPLVDKLFIFGTAAPVFTLLPNSPAIDNGVNAFCPSIDQRGAIRPNDGNGDSQSFCDIGAYEFYLDDLKPIYLPLVVKS